MPVLDYISCKWPSGSKKIGKLGVLSSFGGTFAKCKLLEGMDSQSISQVPIWNKIEWKKAVCLLINKTLWKQYLTTHSCWSTMLMAQSDLCRLLPMEKSQPAEQLSHLLCSWKWKLTDLRKTIHGYKSENK